MHVCNPANLSPFPPTCCRLMSYFAGILHSVVNLPLTPASLSIIETRKVNKEITSDTA